MKQRLIWLIIGILLAAILLFGAGERWAKLEAASVTREESRQLAISNTLLFNSELEKFRLLPVALAEYPDVTKLLSGAGSDVVNDRLDRLAQKTKAAAIYVIGGVTASLARIMRSDPIFATR
jgi:two-component system, NtrC family, C4-dicarboxylate transport sensor histidine kinase DctB